MVPIGYDQRMTDDSQPQSHAEQTDPSTLGETIGQHDRPGDSYPPERPLAVDDPSILDDGRIARDDVEARSEREQPEEVEAGRAAGGVGHDLLDPSADPDRLDDEPQMVATEGDDGVIAAEVAAVHDVPPGSQR